MAASLVMTTALAIPGMSLADQHGPHGGHHGDKWQHHEHMLEKMAEKLDLTEEQKAKIKANHEAKRAEHRQMRKELHEVRQEVREALEAGADQATLDKLATKLGSAEIKMMRHRQKMHEQLESILTDEQKAKLEKMHSERRQHRMERRKERSGGQ